MGGRADTQSGAFPRKILWNKRKRFMGVWVKQGYGAGWGQGLLETRLFLVHRKERISGNLLPDPEGLI